MCSSADVRRLNGVKTVSNFGRKLDFENRVERTICLPIIYVVHRLNGRFFPLPVSDRRFYTYVCRLRFPAGHSVESPDVVASSFPQWRRLGPPVCSEVSGVFDDDRPRKTVCIRSRPDNSNGRTERTQCVLSSCVIVVGLSCTRVSRIYTPWATHVVRRQPILHPHLCRFDGFVLIRNRQTRKRTSLVYVMRVLQAYVITVVRVRSITRCVCV